MRFNNASQAILQTLIYSDIFDFPLTKEEMWKFLVSSKKIEREEFEEVLSNLIKVERVAQVLPHFALRASRGKQVRDFYCLFGREVIVQKRKKNLPEVEKKLSIAKKAAYYLSFIPTVQFIGISGGLALGNVDRNDDIDFFIITKKNTLFMTRFWILIFLEILNLRRKRNAKNPSNKICINLLIDETQLAWPIRDRDLYIVHEIIQMQPVFERDGIYKRFINANDWVKKYFSNFDVSFLSPLRIVGIKAVISDIFGFFLFLWPFEQLMRKLQENYMKKHKTTEIVSKTFIAFHPKDYRTKTLSILRSKLSNLGLLTNF